MYNKSVNLVHMGRSGDLVTGLRKVCRREKD